jgi:hypothetical protein
MNAKTAKKLRKIALGMAVAAEQSGTTVQPVKYITSRTGVTTVPKNTLRGAYKSLKDGLQNRTLVKA